MSEVNESTNKEKIEMLMVREEKTETKQLEKVK